MYIYIDESGIFANPNNAMHSVSAIGALVLPKRSIRPVFRRFQSLLRSWGTAGREIKGSKLDESQTAQVLAMLSEYRLFFAASIIDLGLHTSVGVRNHKLKQADKITENLPAGAHPNLVRQLNELRDRIAQLSDQLYVQAQCLTWLVEDVVQGALLEFTDIPRTYRRFAWRIDAKNQTLTEYEDLWRTVVCPFMQTFALRQPLVTIQEANYRRFRRFENPPNVPHDHLKPYMTSPQATFESVDLKKLMLDNMVFDDSRSDLGLQLADIVVTTLRRACRGTLQLSGWGELGKIMIRPMRSRDAIRFLALENISGRSLPYSNVFATIRQKSRTPVDRFA